MSQEKSAPGAGHKGDPVPVSWLQRDVLLFAASIGATADELHYLYELHPNFAAFPTYPIVLTFKTNTQEVVDFYAAQRSTPTRSAIPGVPTLDSKRVVDGERTMTFHRPIPTTSANRAFATVSTVLGVYDKGKPGTVVETQTDLIDARTGALYTRVVGSAFFVGQGGWGGPKGPKAPAFPPPADGRAPDVTYVRETDAQTALVYRLSGDYNPLHATPEPGKAMGFGGAIVHGLYSWNATAYGLVKTLGGGDPASLREFGARFASPVKPGDTLVTKIWRMGDKDADGWEEVRFVTEVKGGKVCLSNGRAKMRVKAVEKSSKL